MLSTTGAPNDPAPASLSTFYVSEWQRTQDLATWWLNRMITSPTPIVEKMTLFWHNHFVSAEDKVNKALYMYRQNHNQRIYGMGSFVNLAQNMAIQPAMLAYLDNDANVKGAPNQNFARELMELFLLGVGNYSEDDVIASARAWTGHGIDAATQAYTFTPAEHDTDPKTFFGTTKNWDGPDIITEILTNPAKRLISARFIAKKLWSYFAYPNPDDTIVTALANSFVASGLNIRSLLKAIFLRDEFWSTAARQGLVRSPVEYAVNIMRAAGLTAEDVNPEWYLADMGQQLFYPPDVSGWKQNGYWISTSSASARANFAQHVAWVANDKGKLWTWGTTNTAALVNVSTKLAGLTTVSTNTRQVLTSYVDAQRPVATWPIKTGIYTLTLLSPEMQLA